MRLILGTAQLAERYGVLDESVVANGGEPSVFLRHAVSLGFSAVDTAPSYGEAESLIGSAGIDIEVHTKIPAGADPRPSLERSLDRLDRTSVAVAYLHDPDAALDGASVRQAQQVLGPLAERIGVSVYSPAALAAALKEDPVSVVQLPCNPLQRHVLDAVDRSRRQDVWFIARGVLAQGLLATPPRGLPPHLSTVAPFIAAYQHVCCEIERTPAEAAVLWVRDHPMLDGMIVGATTERQLVELAHAFTQPPLTGPERQLIDRLRVPNPSDVDPRNWG